MQVIRAGELEIEVNRIFGEHVPHNGAVVESLQVAFPADVTEEQLEALIDNPWEIYDDTGALQGVQAGVNHIKEYMVTFLKVPETALLQAQLDKVTAEAAALRVALAAASNDAATYQEALKRVGAGESQGAEQSLRDMMVQEEGKYNV